MRSSVASGRRPLVVFAHGLDAMHTQAESRLASLGAVRAHAIVVETEPVAVNFWYASGWERQVDRLRFVKG
jgi:hypothetical protein